MNEGCSLCNHTGRQSSYDDEWDCPNCKHEFKTNVGLKFTDDNKIEYVCLQMVSTINGKAYAVLDLANGKEERFMFSASVEDEAMEWRESQLSQAV